MSSKRISLTITYLKITFLMLSIPLANKFGFWLGSFFHDPVENEISSAPLGDMYGFTILWLIIVSLIFLGLICYLHDQEPHLKSIALILHVVYCYTVVYTTQSEYSLHPYEHALQIVACWSTIFTKPILDHIFYKLLN